MKKLSFCCMLLIASCCHLIGQSKVMPLNDTVLFVLYLKANKVDIRDCSDDFVIYAWHFLGGGKLNFTDEFAKKRYADKAKGRILSVWKEYNFTSTYTYTAVRPIGTYNFDRHFFPIMEDNQMNVMTGGFDHSVNLDGYKTNITVNEAPLELEFDTPDSLNFSLRLKEGDAEKFIHEKDSLFLTKEKRDPGYRNATFFDRLGNRITGKDRRIFLKYYVKILDKEDPYFSQNVYSKDIYTVIQKITAYQDEDYRKPVAIIYP